MTELRIASAGDAALLVEWPARIDPLVSSRAVALAQAVRAEYAAAVRDVVVGYCSATVYFDPLHVDGVDALEAAIVRMPSALPDRREHNWKAGADRRRRVLRRRPTDPICPTSRHSRAAPVDDVIALHSGVTYRVYVVGFVPGFPYMASVDPRLALPRRATPRMRVPAGSVAIAAGQTGIYPSETPGGWHLIGRTHVKPYDDSRAEPFLFKPGDRVRFHPVDRAEFERSA